VGGQVGKKRLVGLVAHAPQLESCLAILDRAAQRGNVGVDLFLNRRLLLTNKGLSTVLSKSSINTTFCSRAYLELFSFWKLRQADAVLSYSDPLALKNKFRLKDRFLIASGTPSIFVQHGLIQEGVNLDSEWLGQDWYADLVLWWAETVGKPPAFINEALRQKVKVVGFLKKNLIAPREFPSEVSDFLAKFKKRILVCTAIPRRNKLFTEDDLTQLYQMLGKYCHRHPEHLVMLRPHRARKASMGGDAAKVLSDDYENLIVMDRYIGPFAYSTMHDSLKLSDVVVSHASSALLDAIYSNQPTALLQNHWHGFDGLPNIIDLPGLEDFIATSESFNIKQNMIRQRFGEIENNLDKAVRHIENFMNVDRYN
jgi:hypothetical protein